MTIPCHLSRFYLFIHMPKHDMDFTEVQVMEFPWHERENDGISHVDLVLFSTKLPSKRHEKISVTIFTGVVWIYFYIVSLFFRMEYDSLKSYIMCFNFTFHKAIKVVAQMMHANSMCCGQGIRLVYIIKTSITSS